MKNERAESASCRLFDRHGVRAEWARLKKGPEQPPIQRARWYGIVDYDSPSDFVTLDVDGTEAGAPCSRLKLAADIPEKAVVYQASIFGAPGAQMTYNAVCPKGHTVRGVDPRSAEIRCSECRSEFQWEREEA